MLPEPSHSLKMLSQQLSTFIRQEMKEGPLSFARFMELALYTPELGYYENAHEKIGRFGSFVTAPTLSPLFARCFSTICRRILTTLEQPGSILEIGAGTGHLAHDLLRVLGEAEVLPERYWILERSHALQKHQQQLFQDHPYRDRVVWLSEWPPVPFHGIVIANEVLDALPVSCFMIQNQALRERTVEWDGRSFCWGTQEPSPELKDYYEALQLTFPEGYCSEANLSIHSWLRNASQSLQQGMILLVDYGSERSTYYHPQKNQGSLRCFYQHCVHSDPFFWPGLQDITADVDFTAVAEMAKKLDLKVHTFMTQGRFLLENGILSLLPQVPSSSEDFAQVAAVKQLVQPDQMGERIKVMALSRDLRQLD